MGWKLTSWLANLRKNLLDPWKLFLLLALVFGGLFVFLVSPLHGNDEIVHFPRAYHVAEGNLRVEPLGGWALKICTSRSVSALNMTI